MSQIFSRACVTVGVFHELGARSDNHSISVTLIYVPKRGVRIFGTVGEHATATLVFCTFQHCHECN